MKTLSTYFRAWAIFVIASATVVSCDKELDIDQESVIQPAEPQVYHVAISATRGEDTKALAVDGKTLNATWAEGEEVTVYNETKSALLVGTLKADNNGSAAQLKGSLTGTVEEGDELKLRFLSGNYFSQKGTIDYVASHCDAAEATVTVNNVDGASFSTTNAVFTNQQAIVKFTLKDGANSVNASRLSISAESGKLVKTRGMRGTDEKTLHSGYIVDGGSGSSGDQPHNLLLDGNTSTKWCTNASTKTSGAWFVEFHTSEAVQVDGFRFTTGDDTQTYPGRNPLTWILKAKASGGDEWAVIDIRTNNTELPANNLESHDFDVEVQGKYQYFHLELRSNQYGDTMQLSEMRLYSYSGSTFSTRYGAIEVVPSAAGSEFSVALSNESGADTYKLSTTVDGKAYYFIKSGVTFENGKYYAITVNMKHFAMASTATEADKGKLICADGHIHAYGEDADCTAARIAKIFYVGSGTDNSDYKHGLAMALTNEADGTVSEAIKACDVKNANSPVVDACWVLPTKPQWEAIRGAAGGYEALKDGFSSVGGENLGSYSYWTNSWYDNNYYYNYESGTGNIPFANTDSILQVRACLVF